jgi:hypothetical protein
MAAKTIEQVLEDKTDEWMAIPGVVGTAIGAYGGRPCIKILTSSDTRAVRVEIPTAVEGHPIVVEAVGDIRALDQEEPV